MKKLILISTILSIIFCACGKNEPTKPTTSVEDIYTSVALTITAQYTPIIPTGTLLPTLTFTPEPSPTTMPTMASTTLATVSYSYSGASMTGNSCDSSAFISDVTIADGTVLAPGEYFEKTWLLENNGSCEWSKDYVVAFISGEDMGGSDTEIDTVVSSGEQVKVTIAMVAPNSEGTYTGFWKMMNEEGVTFGTSFYVQIVVSDSASTITPTPTATAYTSTPTSTSAVAVTSTPIPTTVIVPSNTPLPATPTYTLAPTFTPIPSATDVQFITETPPS